MMESKSTVKIHAVNDFSWFKELLDKGLVTKEEKLEMKKFVQSMRETVKIDIERDNEAMDELKARMIEYKKDTTSRIKEEIEQMISNPKFEKELVTQDRKTNEFFKHKVRDFGYMKREDIVKEGVEPVREKVSVIIKEDEPGAEDLLKN